ncbi:MAG: disulfide bond formation protein DsbA [Pseudomonadales bacterium RIFCSPLOWO2_12_59_9]|nr:MAG: disulfide bond formation protein DsbA [Pseudomonadales bacterium RIFCSPLOWO2_12_59_9]
MNRRTIVLAIGVMTILSFATAVVRYKTEGEAPQAAPVAAQAQAASALVRFDSPTLGPINAPVTIVEFFDPSCESCRAFFPYLKQIMAKYPNDVRIVVRYALLHKGSEEAVRLLESARLQGIYAPVLEAVLNAQPQWHDDPKALMAWEAAQAVGLDVEKARETMNSPRIEQILGRDAEDAKTLGIQGTPAFFVNGKPLNQFGPKPLLELVQSEVEKARKQAR